MKKTVRNVICFICILTLLTSLSSISVSAATVKMNYETVVLCKGKTKQLKLKGYKKTVKWKSSNKKAVPVSKKGKIKGKKIGVATITAIACKKKYRSYVLVTKHKYKDGKCIYCGKNNGKSGSGIDGIKSGTYGGISFKINDDAVKYYNNAYNYTKAKKAKYKKDGQTNTYYKMLGEERLEIKELLVDGKEVALLNKLVPSIESDLNSPSVYGLSPSVNAIPHKDNDKNGASLAKSRLKVSDLNYIKVKDNGDGTITVTMKAKAKTNSQCGLDSQGHLFTTWGSGEKTVNDISVLSFAKGNFKKNATVKYSGGKAVVRIDTKTGEIVKANYTLKVNYNIKHVNITVIKDKTINADIVMTRSYPISKKDLREKYGIEK